MPQIKHKYKSKPCDIDNIKFQSKKEASYYKSLKLATSSGELIFFIRQVPFHLPGGAKYLCDFVEFWSDGEVRFVDVKGFRTETYKIKKRIVEAIYPIEIKEV